MKPKTFLNKITPREKVDLKLCIDIGTHSLKLILLKHLPDKTNVIDHRILPISNEENTIQTKIISSVKKLTKKYPRAGKNVFINISGDNTFIRRINLPPMEEKEIKNAAKWEMEEHVSFPIIEENIKYQIIDAGDSKKQEIIAATISSKMADMLTNVVKETNINVKSVYLTPSSLNNIINKFFKIKEDEAIGILNIGFKESTINIYDINGLQLTREISVTSDSITKAITGTFNFQNKKIIQ